MHVVIAFTSSLLYDNPQVQGIIVAIHKGVSDKYGVSNKQGAKGKINILSSPIIPLIRLHVHQTFASI